MHPLPESLRLLLGAGYPGEALRPLIEHYGGRQIRVPKSIKAEHELAKILGLEAATVLIQILGGAHHWEVPTGYRALTAARHAAIRRDYDRLLAEGCRNRMAVLIARYRPITTRQVRNILKRAE